MDWTQQQIFRFAQNEAAVWVTVEFQRTARGLGEESNKEWRPMPPVPFGLLPKTLSAALQRLAGHLARRSRSTLRWAFSAMQRVCAHSVNRP